VTFCEPWRDDLGAALAPTFTLILVDQRPTMPDESGGMRSIVEISVTKKGPNLLDERVRKREKV
jgi:hypothetical protein